MSNLVPISIDLTELQSEFGLLQSQVDSLGSVLVSAITDRIFNNWRVAAMHGLSSTRKAYINGLKEGEGLRIGIVNSTHKFIILTGDLALMIEEGAGAFDMKEKMLNSPKVKTTSKGVRFMTIPFRHATAGSIGESEVFANVMPKEINQIVKNLLPTKTTAQGNKTSGENLKFGSIPEQYQIPKTRAAFSDLKTMKTYPEYTHQNSIYEGMVRNEKDYENRKQSTYATFRRISDNSSPMSWIHRGIAARNFAQKALANTNVDDITKKTEDEFLINLGF
jgi:hypothetical protein